MASTTANPIQLSAKSNELPKSQGLLARSTRRFFKHRMAVTGTSILVAIILFVSLGTVFFSEADANFNDTSRRLLPISSEHPFGTDTIGRDILARSIYGGQISLLIGITAVTMMVGVGTFVGVLSGYYGGIWDAVLGRIIEAMLSIPQLLLLLVMARFFAGKIPQQELFGRSFSGSVIVIILIIGLTSWMQLARIVRSNVLSLRESEFVSAAKALGASDRRIIMSHILPNTLAPVIVAATLGIAGAILAEAYISFLGLGVQPPTATWGNMLEGAKQYIGEAPWLWIFPGLLIVLSVISINFVGDGLRDALDPRSDSKV
ncbi:MAG: ABC transporter permease [Aggregatilineales bacterium]